MSGKTNGYAIYISAIKTGEKNNDKVGGNAERQEHLTKKAK